VKVDISAKSAALKLIDMAELLSEEETGTAKLNTQIPKGNRDEQADTELITL
jgi:hypothetical protein